MKPRSIPGIFALPILVCSASLAVGARDASAQAQPGAATTEAKEQERTSLYREGVALAEAGRLDEAIKKFERVVAIRSAPPALIALATAQEKAGKLVAAKRTYARARDDARAAKDDTVLQKADAAIASLEPRVPRLTVRLPADGTNAEVMVDGSLTEAASQGIEIDPGEHRIVVTSAGKQPFDERFTVAAGQRKELVVQFASSRPPEGPAQTLTPVAGASSELPRSGPPLGALALGGAGAIATVAGLAVRIAGQSTYNEASSGCHDASCPAGTDIDRGNAARDRMMVGTVVAGAGLCLIGGGALWWALSASSSKGEQTGSRNDPHRISVGATPLVNGAWMSVSGTF